ncbi:hypothetical protein LCGC14_2614240 [marine sediment metagenome]|uniref:Uncharacterized protein n=1 Tax=marine sediment metagenome TaxID=412755 RepID=A0A0F9A570_9ZZZZ
MATKHKKRQDIIRYYKEQTGQTDVDMREAAKWAAKKNLIKLPKPTDPIDILAKQFSASAREETRTDRKSGRPYRVNHMFPGFQGEQKVHLWCDIDDPSTTREKIHKSLIMRREQMVGDGVQLTFDAMHWNSIHPKEEPIEIPMDFEPDVEWAMNTPNEESEAS